MAFKWAIPNQVQTAIEGGLQGQNGEMARMSQDLKKERLILQSQPKSHSKHYLEPYQH